MVLTEKQTDKANHSSFTMEESKRISILKVWLTIMVVFIHSYSEEIHLNSGDIAFDVPIWLDTVKYVVSLVISRCAVPAFFFISAFFLYRKPFSWKSNIKKKIRTLVIPYILLNSFWIAFFFVAQHIPAVSDYFANPDKIVAEWDLARWVGAYLGSPSNVRPMLYPLWFVRDLFVLNILAVIFEKVIEKFPKCSVTLLFILWLLAESTNIFFMDIQALCFWGFGCWFVKRNQSLSTVDRMNSAFVFLSYLILVMGDVVLKDSAGIEHLIISRLCIIMGIIFFYKFTTILSSDTIKEKLLFISKYSFSIYLFHEMNLTILQKICVKIFPVSALF